MAHAHERVHDEVTQARGLRTLRRRRMQRTRARTTSRRQARRCCSSRCSSLFRQVPNISNFSKLLFKRKNCKADSFGCSITKRFGNFFNVELAMCGVKGTPVCCMQADEGNKLPTLSHEFSDDTALSVSSPEPSKTKSSGKSSLVGPNLSSTLPHPIAGSVCGESHQ